MPVPMEEIYTFDDEGTPVPKFYTPLPGGVFVEDQERGQYQRGEDGRMQEVLRASERRGVMDRALGRDDPRKINERTWIDKAAGVPGTVGRTLKEGAADLLEGAAVIWKPHWDVYGDPVMTEDGEILDLMPTKGAEDLLLGRAAAKLRGSAAGTFVHPNDRDDFLVGQLPAELTQMGTQMATAAVGGPWAAVTMLSTQAAGRGYREAREFGASEEDAVLAGLLNAPVGAFEMAPITAAFKRVNAATGGTLLQSVKRMLADGVEGALEEGIQEVISQSLSNKVAKEIYDENREVFGGTTEAMQQGGAVGFIANLLLSGMARTRAGMDAARRANAPEEVWAEYIPPPEPVDAEWLSDKTGLARREGGVSGPARNFAIPPLGPGRRIGQVQLPGGLELEGLPAGEQQKRIAQTRFPLDGSRFEAPADVDAELSLEEESQLSVARISERMKAEVRKWREPLEANRNKAFERLQNRVRRTPLRENDHPVARLRERIRQSGGIRFDGSIEGDVWDKVPKAYKAAKGKGGVLWEDLISETREMGLEFGEETTDPTALLDLLTGPKSNPDGSPRFPPSWYAEEMQALSEYYAPELSEEQMRKTPVGEVLSQFNPNSPQLSNFLVRPDALEVGDIVRVEDELYQVQEMGRVKVLRDGQIIELDPKGEYVVNGVVKPVSPVYGRLRDVYNRIESALDTSAPDPDAMPVGPFPAADDELWARMQLERELNLPESELDLNPDGSPRFPPSWYAEEMQALSEDYAPKLSEEQMRKTPVGEVLSQFNPNSPQLSNFLVLPEGFALEGQTPEDVNAARAREQARRNRADAEERMAAPLRGTAGDVAQSRLFNDEAQLGLFEGPSAEDQAFRASEVEVKAYSESRNVAGMIVRESKGNYSPDSKGKQKQELKLAKLQADETSDKSPITDRGLKFYSGQNPEAVQAGSPEDMQSAIDARNSIYAQGDLSPRDRADRAGLMVGLRNSAWTMVSTFRENPYYREPLTPAEADQVRQALDRIYAFNEEQERLADHGMPGYETYADDGLPTVRKTPEGTLEFWPGRGEWTYNLKFHTELENISPALSQRLLENGYLPALPQTAESLNLVEDPLGDEWTEDLDRQAFVVLSPNAWGGGVVHEFERAAERGVVAVSDVVSTQNQAYITQNEQTDTIQEPFARYKRDRDLPDDSGGAGESGQSAGRNEAGYSATAGSGVPGANRNVKPPRTPYQAAQRLKEAGLVPEELSAGDAAAFVVQESLADYIAGKQQNARKFMEKIGPKANGPALDGDFRSADPEVEARLEKNEKIPSKKPWEVSPERLREMARSFTRAYPEIKDTDGAIIYLLESTAHVSGAAEAISKGHLADVVGKLGKDQYKLFQRLLVGRDVARSIEEGLYVDKEIPFGWSGLEAVRSDLDRWEADAARNPAIARALERRSGFMQQLRDDLVASNLLPEAVQSVDDYFHRLVTEYLEAKPSTGTTKAQGLQESTSGFQRRRQGGGDFITDYLTAEHDVVTHALAQLRYKEIRDVLQSLTDKAGEVKQVARQRNLEAVHGGAENYRRVREALEKVANIRAEAEMDGAYDSEAKKQIKFLLDNIEKIDALRPYRAMKAQAISQWEQATASKMAGDPNEIMNEAIQGKHGEGANWAAAQWFKAIAQEEGFIKDTLKGDYHKWKGGVDKRLIPAGYMAWRPKSGHRMFKALSVSEAVIEGILDGQRELLPTDVREVLVSAGMYPEWIVPENVGRALNRMSQDKAMNGFDATLQSMTKRWKSYKLMAPWHTVKYYFNNFIGDVDFVLALEPRILKYVRQATGESTDINLRNRRLSKDMEFMAMNGVIGGQVRGEIGHIRRDELFSIVTGEKPHLVQRYMGKLGPLQKQREDILRIAAYRFYTDEIKAGRRPVGVSNPKQVRDLYERGMMKEAAAMLAKQSMIDYDNPTVFGQFVKDRAIPFYRWREGNAIRYTRLIRDIFRQDAGQRDRAKRAGPVMAGITAATIAKRGAQLFLLSAIRAAWNHIFFPDEEELLDESGRRGHLILSPAGKDGVFDSVRIEGALPSFLATFGLEEFGEIAASDNPGGQILKNAANDWAQGVSPFAKTTIEAAMGYQSWPDIFNPRPVDDRAEHMLKIWSADSLYRKVTDMPLRPGRQQWVNPKSWLVFSTDAGQSAYWATRNQAQEWRRQNTDNNWRPGKPTDKDVYLKFFRQAHQYNQPEAAEKWLNQYLDAGGNLRSVYKSLDNQHPLIGLSQDERLQFVSGLDDRQMDMYQAAIKHYQQHIQSGSVDKDMIMEIMRRRSGISE